MTYREYLVRLEWIKQQYEEPSRNDFYIMQLTGVVAHLLDKSKKQWQPGKYRLNFKKGRSQKDGLSPQQRAALAKARWARMADAGLPPSLARRSPNANSS